MRRRSDHKAQLLRKQHIRRVLEVARRAVRFAHEPHPEPSAEPLHDAQRVAHNELHRVEPRALETVRHRVHARRASVSGHKVRRRCVLPRRKDSLLARVMEGSLDSDKLALRSSDRLLELRNLRRPSQRRRGRRGSSRRCVGVRRGPCESAHGCGRSQRSRRIAASG
eukprot:Amastigsp_a1043_192.p3 type:complete len:167 gc:universal Amastigsp_a1043_192:651-151(-)